MKNSAAVLKSDNNYMNAEQREHFRKILLDWKASIQKDMASSISYIKEDHVNYADPVDQAAQAEGFRLELRTVDRERQLVAKINQALDDLKTGTYGFCEECGADIGFARLEARPTATKCIDCKTFQEIREKQTGN